MAAKAGQADAMWQLIKAGANKDVVDGAGVNLVLAVAEGRSAPAMALALELVDDANVADKQQTTALHRLAGGPWFEGLARNAAPACQPRRAGPIWPMAGARPRCKCWGMGLPRCRPLSHDVFPEADEGRKADDDPQDR